MGKEGGQTEKVIIDEKGRRERYGRGERRTMHPLFLQRLL